MTKVLIVDDDPSRLAETEAAVLGAGFAARAVGSGSDALEHLRNDGSIAVVLLDMVMPDLDGMGVLDAMHKEGLVMPVIAQIDPGREENAEAALQHGATDYLVKPVGPARLGVSVRNALALDAARRAVLAERQRARRTVGLETLLGETAGIERVRLQAHKVAKTPMPVLIEGERGTGKALIARAIHGASERAGKPFVVLDCRTVPAGETEAYLLGDGKDDDGAFAAANGGTLFIKEVGALPPAAQALLLEVLETGQFTPPWARRPHRVNLRILAATSRRLLNLAKAGTIREDLYYRLTVCPLYLPPLRERGEDVALLATRFAARFAAEEGRGAADLSPAALALLATHDWPGNVGELERAIFRAVTLTDRARLAPEDFPRLLARRLADAAEPATIARIDDDRQPEHIDAPLPDAASRSGPEADDRFLDERDEVRPLAEIERDLILFAIERYEGRFARVARVLGIGRSTLYRKLRDYGLDQDVRERAA